MQITHSNCMQRMDWLFAVQSYPHACTDLWAPLRPRLLAHTSRPLFWLARPLHNSSCGVQRLCGISGCSGRFDRGALDEELR